MSRGARKLELDGRGLTVTSLERVLWPATGFTKGDLIDYYTRVAPVLLPHLRGRALTLGRFPGGVDRRGFAQTECRGRPDWMAVQPLRLRGGQLRHYCVVNDLPSLVWVANLGTIELHTFLSRGPHQGLATAVAFDLDPGPGAGLLDCCRLALRLREALGALELASFAKTSGSLGLHVLVPLDPPRPFAETKPFARELAGRLAAEDPDRVTDATKRSGRAGRVLVDWLQNDPSRSTAAPYSLRAADQPTVSTPVGWEELEAALSAEDPARLRFVAGDVLRRVERQGDPFRPLLSLRQGLPA